jgi:hypothetical protein
MADPINIAIYGFRTQPILYNTSTGSTAAIDRVQSIEPSFTIPSQPYYELARQGKIGTTQNPPEFRITMEQNLVNSMEAEFLLAGKNIAPAGAQSYNLGDFLGQAGNINAYVLIQNNTAPATIYGEQEFTGLSISEYNVRYTVGGAIMQSFGFVGRQGRFYVPAVTHSVFYPLDDVSLGGIHGKDARLWLTSGSAAANRAFRIQNLNIRATFPTVHVREIGDRTIKGTLSDAPDVNMDFDLMFADQQPADKFFTLTGGYYDFQNPTTAFNAFIRVFLPTDAEGQTVVKMYKIENLLPTAHTPIRSQVRGLATVRYTATMSREATSDSGGLIVSNRNDLT